jgi:hypothetical protein
LLVSLGELTSVVRELAAKIDLLVRLHSKDRPDIEPRYGPPHDDRGYTTVQVARLLGVSAWVARKMCNHGVFPNAVKLPGGRGNKGEWRIPPADLDAAYRNRTARSSSHEQERAT